LPWIGGTVSLPAQVAGDRALPYTFRNAFVSSVVEFFLFRETGWIVFSRPIECRLMFRTVLVRAEDATSYAWLRKLHSGSSSGGIGCSSTCGVIMA